MKKSVQRFVAVSTVIAIVFISACSSNKGSVSVSSAPSQSPNVTEKAATTMPVTPVTLKISGVATAVKTPDGPQSDPVAKEIEKQTGITMDIAWSTDDQHTQVMLASGDLPDILFIGQKFSEQLIDSGAVLDLTKLIDERAPNLKKMQKMLDFSKDNWSDGKNQLFFLGNGISTGKPFMQFAPFVREDYWKEAGYPPVANPDDLVNILMDIVKKHPQTPNGKKVYAVGYHTQWSAWGYSIPFAHILGAANAGNPTAAGNFDMQNKAPSSYTDKAGPFLESAKMLNKLNQAGLLDPDSFTQQYDAWSKKAVDGRYAMIIADWVARDANAALGKAGDSSAGYSPLIPNVPAYPTGAVATPFGGGLFVAISSKTKNPERAIEFLDFLYNPDNAFMIDNGPEGLNWTNENGVKVFKPEFLDKMKNDPNWREVTGVNKWFGLNGTGGFNKQNGQYVDLTQDDQAIPATSLPDYKKDWLAHYGVATEEEAIAKNIKNYATDGTYDALMQQKPDDIKLISDKVDKVAMDSMAKLVLAKNDDEFNKTLDKVIADLKRVGSDNVDAWTKTETERVKSVISKYQ